MKILLANKFFFIKGGAENSFFETAKLLQAKGHQISYFSMQHPRNMPSEYSQYFVSEVDYESNKLPDKLKAAGRLIYSFEAKRKIDELIRKEPPDIVHLNNIYHQISPSILHTIKKHKLPVVMSLRDYKIVCASYSMLSDGAVCEACKNKKYYHCYLKRCVKDSRVKSLLNTLEMYLHHEILKLYELVDIFISPSEFLKNKVLEMGFKGKVICIPNFAMPENPVEADTGGGESIVYFGRVSKEKGLQTLIDAVKDISGVTLKIIGDGPLMNGLKDQVANHNIKNVEFLGYKSKAELKEEVSKSMFTIVPSEWYENNPRSAIESFALGKPVIGANIGGIPELVIDGSTGLTFESGNTDELRDKIRYLISDKEKIVEMGKNARRLVEKNNSPEVYYKKLMEAYNSAIASQR